MGSSSIQRTGIQLHLDRLVADHQYKRLSRLLTCYSKQGQTQIANDASRDDHILKGQEQSCESDKIK